MEREMRSEITERVYQVSRTGMALESPISRNDLSGTVQVTGSVEGVEHVGLSTRSMMVNGKLVQH